MTKPRLDWNDIPILLALARTGSMRTAARQLAIDTSTVSRRLAAAEKRLQTRLFIRKPEGYKPTDAGRSFLAAAEAIEGSVHAMVSTTEAEAEGVAGAVRITSVDTVLNDWLIPRLPALQKMHPRLEIVAIPDNDVLSFTRSEADLAIRIARPREDAAILMRRIGSIGMAVYGNTSFRKLTRQHWPEVPWLMFHDDLADTIEMKWLAKSVPGARSRFRCSSMAALLSACEAGLGIALLPCFAVRSSQLVRLSEGPECHREAWLLNHRQAARIRRFRAVADWIAAAAAKDARLLGGSPAP
jgi:DNA-binding transcriptional LysR family regulator